MKQKLFAASVAVVLAYPVAANAYMFDPDGVGGVAASNITAFDWQPSNVLAYGGNQAVANYITNLQNPTGTQLSTEFQVYSQGQLFGTTGNNISGLCTPGQSTCTGGNYEITYTLGYTEKVTGVTQNADGSFTANFSYVAAQPSFINFFYDASKDSNNLTGQGFDNGTLILATKIFGATSGNFTAYTSTGQPFDDTPDGNNYAGITTLETPPSSGSNSDILLNLSLATSPGDLYRNADFFLEGISYLRFNNMSISPQFTTVNPSQYFDGLSGGNNGGTLAPTIGTSNGATYNGSNPDIQMQTDTNTPIRATVPEPGTLALFGIALVAVGFGSRRRHA